MLGCILNLGGYNKLINTKILITKGRDDNVRKTSLAKGCKS